MAPQVPPGKPQAELDFTYFGGLYRNVRLEVVDRLHVSDPLCDASRHSCPSEASVVTDLAESPATPWSAATAPIKIA